MEKNLSETISKKEEEEESASPRRRRKGKRRKYSALASLGERSKRYVESYVDSSLENSRHVRGGAAIVAPRNTVGQVTRIISGEARNTGQLD